MHSLRAATDADIGAIQAIEVDAGRRFAEAGLDDIANAPPPEADDLRLAIASETCWVATLDAQIAGYAEASITDGQAHLHQVSVAMAFQGRGLGRALIEHVFAWATAQQFTSITLTTFAELSWNGPLYEHLGFVEVTPADGSELAMIRDAEIAQGLDVRPRIAMRRALEQR